FLIYLSCCLSCMFGWHSLILSDPLFELSVWLFLLICRALPVITAPTATKARTTSAADITSVTAAARTARSENQARPKAKTQAHRKNPAPPPPEQETKRSRKSQAAKGPARKAAAAGSTPPDETEKKSEAADLDQIHIGDNLDVVPRLAADSVDLAIFS